MNKRNWAAFIITFVVTILSFDPCKASEIDQAEFNRFCNLQHEPVKDSFAFGSDCFKKAFNLNRFELFNIVPHIISRRKAIATIALEICKRNPNATNCEIIGDGDSVNFIDKETDMSSSLLIRFDGEH